MTEKSRTLTLLKEGDSIIAVARDIRVLRETIYRLKRSAAFLSPGMIPKRKSGSGAPKKTSLKRNKLLKREVKSYPSITKFKKSTMKFSSTSQLGQFVNDFIRILVQRLHKDLDLDQHYYVAVQPRNPRSLQQ